MVPLCASCGETVKAGARCPWCDAPPSAWRPLPRSAAEVVIGAFGALLGSAGVLFFVARIAEASECLDTLSTRDRAVVDLVPVRGTHPLGS